MAFPLRSCFLSMFSFTYPLCYFIILRSSAPSCAPSEITAEHCRRMSSPCSTTICFASPNDVPFLPFSPGQDMKKSNVYLWRLLLIFFLLFLPAYLHIPCLEVHRSSCCSPCHSAGAFLQKSLASYPKGYLLKCHEWEEHLLFRRPPGTAVCFFILLKNNKITPWLASCCGTSMCVSHFIWVLVDRCPHHINLPRWCSCWVFHWKSQGLSRGEKWPAFLCFQISPSRWSQEQQKAETGVSAVRSGPYIVFTKDSFLPGVANLASPCFHLNISF